MAGFLHEAFLFFGWFVWTNIQLPYTAKHMHEGRGRGERVARKALILLPASQRGSSSPYSVLIFFHEFLEQMFFFGGSKILVVDSLGTYSQNSGTHFTLPLLLMDNKVRDRILSSILFLFIDSAS